MQGRVQVVTVHPPLPPAVADPAADLDACRTALAAVLGEYVRRYPEQCYSLAFGAPDEAEPRPARRPPADPRTGAPRI
jgi:hypothetical protein